MVLMARKSPILTSWHSTPTKAKILAHSLEVSKKKVTSVSDNFFASEYALLKVNFDVVRDEAL